MKKVYVKPEVTKVELEEKHSVTMVITDCKSGDIPPGPGIPFDGAAWPCLEEVIPGSYFDVGELGVRPRNCATPGEFAITDS